MLSVDRASELLVYDKDTGVLAWKVYRPGTPAGSKAGTPNGNGYVRVYVDCRPRYAHRLAWMLHYQELPPTLIDHINGDRSDNRICNLRAGDKRLNAENMKVARSDSSHGYLGATFSKRQRAWFGQIVAMGKQYRLGPFATPTEAHDAYIKAKRKLHVGNTL